MWPFKKRPLSRAGHVCRPPCEARAKAMREGEFIWVHGLGWVFVDVPKRKDGFPFVFDTCVWCGGDLFPPDMGEGPE